MNTEIVKVTGKSILGTMKRESPTILTAIGIGGFITALFMSARDTKRYELKLDEHIRQKAVDTDTPEEDIVVEKTDKAKVLLFSSSAAFAS